MLLGFSSPMLRGLTFFILMSFTLLVLLGFRFSMLMSLVFLAFMSFTSLGGVEADAERPWRQLAHRHDGGNG